MIDPASFESELKKLIAGFATKTANVGCLACERCLRCGDSTFCVDGQGLVRCHYCTACAECTECVHCQRSTGCLSCSHCVACERCTGSAYLVRSVGCSGCTYCFGCVGLGKRDFHILNVPYSREDYFKLTAELARKLK